MAKTKVTGDLIATGTITAANLVSGTLDSVLNTYLSTNAYATEGYVNTALSNLIGAAPASLDTLNELASALNDDANFATTVTNSLATKLNLSGGTISGDLAVTGNLTVDTDTLYVDAASNNVGIDTTSPSQKLDVNGTVKATLVDSPIKETRTGVGLSFWQGTQAQYNALGSYDSNTVYFVT